MSKIAVTLATSNFALFIVLTVVFSTQVLADGPKMVSHYSPGTPHYLPGTTCIGARSEGSKLARNVFSNFEGKSVSSEIDLTLLFTRENPIIAMSGSNNPLDEFYCKQAVWESLPVNAITDKEVTLHFSQYFGNQESCKYKFFAAHNANRSECVVLHLIPPSVLMRYPQIMSVEDIHNESNLAAVPISNANEGLMTQFRNEWISYFRQNQTTTKDDLYRFRTRLIDQYKKLFII